MAEDPECFQGSYCNGPSVDIPTWAGLSLTDEETDALWNRTDAVFLLRSLESAWLDEEEFEGGGPGQSDTYYVLRSADPDACKSELRSKIMEILGNP